MEEKLIKVKMLRNSIGRQGVHKYRSELFEKGKVYEITESLAKAFLSKDTKLKSPAAENVSGRTKAEPKEKKMEGPAENK